MQFGLLGSLVVVGNDGRALDLGGNQSRAVLAVLLAAAGRVVTAESLVDILWGEDPPASAPGTLQSYISRLRRELEPGRARGAEARILLWEPPGYRLAVGTDDVDFRRFEARADQGRSLLAAGRPDDARDVLLEADNLWRGPALVEYRDREFAMGFGPRRSGELPARRPDRGRARHRQDPPGRGGRRGGDPARSPGAVGPDVRGRRRSRAVAVAPLRCEPLSPRSRIRRAWPPSWPPCCLPRTPRRAVPLRPSPPASPWWRRSPTCWPAARGRVPWCWCSTTCSGPTWSRSSC